MKKTVINLLNQAVEKYGNAPYVLDKDKDAYQAKSFVQVREEATCFASALIDLNFEKNDKIAILSEGRSNWVIGEYGILLAGCTAVPLSIKLQPEEILFRLNHSDSKAILISRNTIEKLLPIWHKIERQKFHVIYLDNELEAIHDLLQKVNIDNSKILLFGDLLKAGKVSLGTNDKALKSIESKIEEHDIATICYTSGTTGNPKGIMLTQLNYYANSSDAMDYFNTSERLRLYIILPLDHSFAHTVCIYASLLRGLAIYFVDARGGGKNTLRNIPINMKEANPHFLLTVPALSGNFMNKIIDGINAKGGFAAYLFHKGLNAGIALHGNGFRPGNIKGLQALRLKMTYRLANKLVFKKVRQIFGNNLMYCVGGGALLDISQQRFFYSLGIPIYQGYGLTEATPIISANTPRTHKLGSSGKVLPSIECRILKSDGTEAKTGEKGEIVIKGENVMTGYYKNPTATAETIKDGLLFTGDLGYMDEDGFLFVVGREKALLIAQDGEKYPPEEIEEAIINCSDYIAQAMLYNDHKKYTTALITLNTGRVEHLIREKQLDSAEALWPYIQASFYNFKQHDDYADKFQSMWIPSQFRIIEEPFSEQNQMINSTMKMVRYKITNSYQSVLDSMYEAGNQAATLKANKASLQKLFKLS